MNYRDLTEEQLRQLAATNRLMDEGVVPFVIFRGERFPFTSDSLARFGIVSGQTVDMILLLRLREIQEREVAAEQIADQLQGPEAP